MIVRKYLRFSSLVQHLFKPVIYFCLVSVISYVLYNKMEISEAQLPTEITAVMGTALAIFIGFRNGSSYDRWWEARKIWGGIVNESRTFGRQVTTLVTLQHHADKSAGALLKTLHKEFIYRHLAWINALRLQLRKQDLGTELTPFLDAEEEKNLMQKKNKATQLIQKQAERFTEVLYDGFVEDFRHIQFDNTLTKLYDLQGKAERIKHTPLPRQYDYFINMFLWCFVTLLPFTLVNSLATIGIACAVIPLSVLISLCFYVVAGVAAYNEDPFENRSSDTPMTALCRTIEIDLREQLGEIDLPPEIKPENGFLM